MLDKSTQYGRAPLWLFDEVSQGALLLFVWLDGKYGGLQSIFPSEVTLAQELGVSVATVKRRLGELRDAKALTVTRRYGTSNEYDLHFDQPTGVSMISTEQPTANQRANTLAKWFIADINDTASYHALRGILATFAKSTQAYSDDELKQALAQAYANGYPITNNTLTYALNALRGPRQGAGSRGYYSVTGNEVYSQEVS